MAGLLAGAAERESNGVIVAVGPESFSFAQLVRLIATRVRCRVGVVRVPVSAAYVATRVVGWLVRDVVLTWEEYKGLMANLLAVEGPATGQTRLSDWLAENADRVGRRYASEVARHYDKSAD
jgi:hypothetical protein